jgi:hypothetical protein
MKMSLTDNLDIMKKRINELYKFEGFSTTNREWEYKELVTDINDLLKDVNKYFGITDEDIRKETDGRTNQSLSK